jgi:hypothetical protein
MPYKKEIQKKRVEDHDFHGFPKLSSQPHLLTSLPPNQSPPPPRAKSYTRTVIPLTAQDGQARNGVGAALVPRAAAVAEPAARARLLDLGAAAPVGADGEAGLTGFGGGCCCVKLVI